MASITLEGIDKIYPDGTHAVRDLDLAVADGELVVLLGPSGCGKSTLLRLIAGLEPLSSGTVHIGNRCVNGEPPDRRDVAMVFQNYALYGHMTVRGNIGFPLRMRGVARDERRKRVAEISAMLELDDVLDARPGTLSGGQQQRVAMGRALVRHPAAFLLDEPLSNLDARLRTHVREELRRIQRQLGVTTVHVTHDQVEALSLGDRVAVMRDGRLQQYAPGQELYERPANTFVAAFLGHPGMNLFEAAMAAPSGDGSMAVSVPGLADPLPVGIDGTVRDERLTAGAAIFVGIRPEDVELVGNDQAGVPGTIEAVEELGSERVIHVALPFATVDLTRSADSTAPGLLAARLDRQHRAPQLGARVAIRLPKGALRLFDRQGRAIDLP
ncbi:MAG: ATP-binding cassette domain-containing protein [Gemmatimonadota bacterium]